MSLTKWQIVVRPSHLVLLVSMHRTTYSQEWDHRLSLQCEAEVQDTLSPMQFAEALRLEHSDGISFRTMLQALAAPQKAESPGLCLVDTLPQLYGGLGCFY